MANSLTDIVLGLLAASFTLLGHWALGRFTTTQVFKAAAIPTSLEIVAGFPLFFFAFLGLSLFLPAKWPTYILLALMLLIFLQERKYLWLKINSAFSHYRWFYLILVLLLLPVISRVLGPPVLNDGLKHYLPAVEWIFEKGLEFNPYLTGYTTMPQGAEYLFTLPHALGGYQAVRIFDALLGLVLLHVVFQTARLFTSQPGAFIAVLLVLLVPRTWLWLLGQAKVDTMAMLLFMAGLYLTFSSWRRSHPTFTLVLLSSALAVKYTFWVLLLAPTAYFFIKIFLVGFKPKNLLLFIIPILFVAPVMVKNKIQVNNYLAPVIITGKETRFIQKHRSQARQKLIEERKAENRKNIYAENLIEDFRYLKSWRQLLGSVKWWVLGISCLTLIFAVSIYKTKPKLTALFLLGLAMLVIWINRLGVAWHVPRFIWPILVIYILFSVAYMEHTLAKLKTDSKAQRSLWLALATLLIIGNGVHSYIRNYHYFEALSASFSKPLAKWYQKQERPYFAFSAALDQKKLPASQTIYLIEPAFGLMSFESWQAIGTQEAIYQNITEKRPLPKKGFLVCHQTSIESLFKRFGARLKVNMKEGEYYLLEFANGENT